MTATINKPKANPEHILREAAHRCAHHHMGEEVREFLKMILSLYFWILNKIQYGAKWGIFPPPYSSHSFPRGNHSSGDLCLSKYSTLYISIHTHIAHTHTHKWQHTIHIVLNVTQRASYMEIDLCPIFPSRFLTALLYSTVWLSRDFTWVPTWQTFGLF